MLRIYDEWLETIEMEQGRKTGGGIFLDLDLGFTIVDSEQQRSFEHLIIEVGVNGQKYNFVIVYQPPQIEGESINSFLDEFTIKITKDLSYRKNIVILGDFNVHVNDKDDIEAQQFNDKMEASGLDQQVNFPTHKFVNT